MPSHELESFVPASSIRIIAATEIILPYSLRVMFWIIDPEQQIIWPNPDDNLASCLSEIIYEDELGYTRRHYLWQQTCFELFIGIQNQSLYREINLSTAELWNCYQFEDYRQPVNMPPVVAHDIQLLELKTQLPKIEAVFSLHQFMQNHDCRWDELVVGLASVIKTRKTSELYFALQHSGQQADFHLRKDWICRL